MELLQRMEHQQAQHHQLAALEVSWEELKGGLKFKKITSCCCRVLRTPMPAPWLWKASMYCSHYCRSPTQDWFKTLMKIFNDDILKQKRKLRIQIWAKKTSGGSPPPCHVSSNPKTFSSNSHQGCHHGNIWTFEDGQNIDFRPAPVSKELKVKCIKDFWLSGASKTLGWNPGVVGDGAGPCNSPVDRDQGVLLAGWSWSWW